MRRSLFLVENSTLLWYKDFEKHTSHFSTQGAITMVQAEKKKRVDWHEPELTLVIPKAVDLMQGNPKINVGQAIWEAQNLVLPEDRRKVRTSMWGLKAEQVYGKMIEKELARRARQKAKEERQATASEETTSHRKSGLRRPLVATPESSMSHEKVAETLRPRPIQKAIGTPQDRLNVPSEVATSMGGLVTRLITSVGDAYEQALYEELRNRGQKAVMRAAMDEAAAMRAAGMKGMQASMPPAPPPAEVKETQVLKLEHKSGESEMQILVKPKIGLVGDVREDWKYFDRIKQGLDDSYEFVEIVKLKDTPQAAHCDMLVFSGSVDNKVLNAVKGVAPNVLQLFNKGSTVVNAMLVDKMRQRKTVHTL
jgi:hypothetical protein